MVNYLRTKTAQGTTGVRGVAVISAATDESGMTGIALSALHEPSTGCVSCLASTRGRHESGAATLFPRTAKLKDIGRHRQLARNLADIKL